MLTVYYQACDSFSESEAFTNAYQQLSDMRKEKVDACKGKEGKQQRLVAGHLLEQSIRAFGFQEPIIYGVSDRGKPFLLTENIKAPQFSISHAKDYCACVVANNAVGVDVEAIGRYKPSVVRRYFTENERLFLEEASEEKRQEMFAAMWTIKEAIAKCLDISLLSICEQCDTVSYLQQVDDTLENEEKKALPLFVTQNKNVFLAIYKKDGYLYSCAYTKPCDVRFEKGIDKL